MTKHPCYREFAAKLRACFDQFIAQRRAEKPHVAAQPGLLPAHLGMQEYRAAVGKGRAWAWMTYREEPMIDELLDHEGRKVGRVFRFKDPYAAFHFRMVF